MLQQMAGNTTWSINWTMADNTTVAHSGSEMIALGLAVAAYMEEAHDNAAALRAALEAAETSAEIAAVDIDTGWP